MMQDPWLEVDLLAFFFFFFWVEIILRRVLLWEIPTLQAESSFNVI